MGKYISFFLLTAIIILSACSAGKMALKKGDKKYDRGEYNVAIDYYEKALDKQVATTKSNFYIAESYRLSNRIKKAEPFYSAAIEDGIEEESAHFYYALSLKANEKYKEAKSHLNDYLPTATNDEIIALAKREVDNLEVVNRIVDKEDFFRVKNLEEINTDAAEYSPVYLNGELYFTSSRYGGKIYKATGTPFTNIYKVKTKGAVVDTTTIDAIELINSENTNDGSVTFTDNGNIMVFAKGNSGRKKGTRDVNLYISRYRRGGWSEPVMLTINDPDAWDSTPAFSTDGRTLYFASNREGGYGGTDLYTATMDNRGRWGRVRNLGPKINTSGNEMFPFVSSDGKLYFASTGHPGFGNLDLFMATRSEGDIAIDNLGPSINSNMDDFGLFLFDPTKGFFSSNREESKGDDDIFTFINNNPDLKIVNYYLSGVTYTYDENGNEILLPNTSVRLVGADDEVLDQTITDQEAKFLFRVYPEESYILYGEKPEFLTTRESFSTVGKSVPKEDLEQLVTNVTFDTKLTLDKIVLDKAVVLDNIYYDLDKANIREDAAQELDKLVTILRDNPEISIELSSHTDSRADAAYNLELSQRRAQAAVDYIITNGVDKGRLTARGYGESQLIIEDAETEEEHQVNRRTEFKVIRYDKSLSKKTDEEEEDSEDYESTGGLEDKINWDESTELQ